MLEMKRKLQTRKLRGIIFDWSGVVVDEIEATGRAHIAVIKMLTGKDVSYEQWRAHIGSNWQTFYLRQGLEASQLSGVLPQFQQEYARFKGSIRLRPGITYVLSTLKHFNYVTAVLSNQARDVILGTASRYDLLKYFDLIVADEDLEKSKPHSEALFQVLRMLDLEPGDVLLLEDMKEGIEMGLDAGVITIGVRSKLEQDLSMADWYIEDITDLLDILDLPRSSTRPMRKEHSNI
jgi:putative hydrolase of the HAD superfamily